MSNSLIVKITASTEKFRAAMLALAAYLGLDKDLQEQIAAWENEGGSYE